MELPNTLNYLSTFQNKKPRQHCLGFKLRSKKTYFGVSVFFSSVLGSVVGEVVFAPAWQQPVPFEQTFPSVQDFLSDAEAFASF